MKRNLCSLLLLLLINSPNSHAALVDRGGGMIYDTDLNITWLQQPNNTTMTWYQAKDWTAGLTAGGVSGWRLPSTVNGSWEFSYDGSTPNGWNNTASEMGHLFYTELGNKGYFDKNGDFQEGWGLVNKGPFTNLLTYAYWSGTEAASPYVVWNFAFSNGSQAYGEKGNHDWYALAVHPGDVGAPVPIPGGIWLFGSGLVVVWGRMAWDRRPKKHQT